MAEGEGVARRTKALDRAGLRLEMYSTVCSVVHSMSTVRSMVHSMLHFMAYHTTEALVELTCLTESSVAASALASECILPSGRPTASSAPRTTRCVWR